MTTITSIHVLQRTAFLGAFTLVAVACQAGTQTIAGSALAVAAAYSADDGQILQENNSPTQYTVYYEELVAPESGPPTFVDQKRTLAYTGGEFVEGDLESTTQKEARDKLLGLEGDRAEIVDRLKGGDKEVYVDERVKIGSSSEADASVVLLDGTNVASKVVLHVNGLEYHRDYEGGFVRVIYPVPGKHGVTDLGVIIDYCGASSCHSRIEILDLTTK